MNTSYTYYILLALALLPIAAPGQPAWERHGLDRGFAMSLYETRGQDFEAAAGRAGLTAPFLFAIVAPEIAQYGYLRDRLETYSLKVFYVQKGKAYADFSTGFFQMKPSFIERLEDSLQTKKHLHEKFKECLLPDPASREARVERLRRLGQMEWQLEYLALFCELVHERFPSKSELPERDMLVFYATAYNTGFHKPEDAIDQMARQALFPRFTREKFRYADVALWFYDAVIEF